MPREPIVKSLIIKALRGGPASFSEIRRRLKKDLKRKINDGVVVYALRDLEKRGLIEKTIDRKWALTSRHPLFVLMRFVGESLKNFEPVAIEDYGALLCDPESIDKRLSNFLDYWKASLWGLRSHFWDAAELFMREAYVDYARRILRSMSPEDRDKVVEALLKLTYLGYMLLKGGSGEEKRMDEFDEEQLSSFLYAGLMRGVGEEQLEQLMRQYEEALRSGEKKAEEIRRRIAIRCLLYNLWMSNILGDLARLAFSRGGESANWKIEELLKEVPELVEVLRRELFDRLVRIRITMIICLDENILIKPIFLLNRFERWFEALKSGALDHREHIFMDVAELHQWEKKLDEVDRQLMERWLQQKPASRVDEAMIALLKEQEERRADIRRIADALKNEWQRLDRLSLLVEFKRFLEKELAGELSLDERKKFEEMMYEKIDLDEPWTLGDLYNYHPRGKTPQFYEEILEEILSRRERRARIHRILDKVLKGVLDKHRLSELKYRGAIHFADIISKSK